MNVAFGSNCEELTQGTHFRIAANNRHRAAERKRSSPSSCRQARCELLLVRSLSAFWKIIADRQVAIRHRGPRDVAGWSIVGGSRDTLLPILGIEPHENIENRSWPTNYRGPVLIHASLKIDKQPCVDHGLDPTKLETGGVVGIAKIVDCVTTHRSRWFEGPYGFVLKNRRG